VHTVGPSWRDGKNNEERDLEKAVIGTLRACTQYQTVALPAISCGIFGFPAGLAAKLTIRTIRDFMSTDSSVLRVDIVITKTEVMSEFRKAFVASFGTEKVSQLMQTSARPATTSGTSDFYTLSF